MVKVTDLLSHPLFSNFHLLSGSGGLHNIVSGTGIFEWESDDEVSRTFKEGEFIVTTLSNAKGDIKKAEASMRMLIQKNVSTIAVKDVYFHEFSEALTKFSDSHNVPVFIFSDTYLDDIIYTVKNELVSFDLYATQSKCAASLLNTREPSEDVKATAFKINRYFFDHCICSYSTVSKNTINFMDSFFAGYAFRELTIRNTPKSVYSFIQYNEGILVIYTTPDSPPNGSDEFEDFLKRMGLLESGFRTGISRPVTGLMNLNTAVQQSVYANISCCIDKESAMHFKDTRLDQILIPLCNERWVKDYYNSLIDKISDYDATHNFNLLETLLTYVSSNEDITLTSKKLFQHTNTVRYRLAKARKILNLDDFADSSHGIFFFARLHQIYEFMVLLTKMNE